MYNETGSRIETELEVISYIQNLHYAIKNGAQIIFQITRNVDNTREIQYTNLYTVNHLFPNENPVDALKRELLSLSIENYIKTVKDTRFPNRSEMREFGKKYGEKDVYIKIRVELLGQYGNPTTFIMSFHFAERAFKPEMFPFFNRQEIKDNEEK